MNEYDTFQELSLTSKISYQSYNPQTRTNNNFRKSSNALKNFNTVILNKPPVKKKTNLTNISSRKEETAKVIPLSTLAISENSTDANIDYPASITEESIRPVIGLSKLGLKELSAPKNLRKETEKSNNSSKMFFPNLPNSVKAIQNKVLNFKTKKEKSPIALNLFPTAVKVDQSKLSKIYRSGLELKQINKAFSPKTKETYKKKQRRERKSNSISLSYKLDKLGNNELQQMILKYQKIQSNAKKENEKTLESIRNDIYFETKGFQLLSPTSFTKAFQRNEFIEERLYPKERKSNKVLNKIIETNYKSKILKDVKGFINKNIQGKKISSFADKLKKCKKAIITAAIHFKDLKMSLKDFYSKKHFIEPYDPKKYEIFIKHVKNGDYEVVASKIASNPYLLYNYDENGHTALHWAAKRNHPDLISILLRFGAKIEAEDIFGNTPLILAAHLGRLEAMKALINESASPLRRNKEGKSAIEMAKDDHIKQLLVISKAIYLMCKTTNNKLLKSSKLVLPSKY